MIEDDVVLVLQGREIVKNYMKKRGNDSQRLPPPVPYMDNETVLIEVGEVPSGSKNLDISMSVEAIDTYPSPKYLGVDTKTSTLFVGVRCRRMSEAGVDVFNKDTGEPDFGVADELHELLKEDLLTLHQNRKAFNDTQGVKQKIDSITVTGPQPDYSDAKDQFQNFRFQLEIDWNRPHNLTN